MAYRIDVEYRLQDIVVGVVSATRALDFVGWPLEDGGGDLLEAIVEGIAEGFVKAGEDVTAG